MLTSRKLSESNSSTTELSSKSTGLPLSLITYVYMSVSTLRVKTLFLSNMVLVLPFHGLRVARLVEEFVYFQCLI